MPVGISSTTTVYADPTDSIAQAHANWKRIPDIPKSFSFHRYLAASEVPPLAFGGYTGSFSYLGPDTEFLVQRAIEFCHNTANIQGNVQPAVAAFLDHVRTQHLQPSHTALWLSIRVSPPSPVFDEPHWHLDGEYFTLKAGQPPAFKIGAVIAGPATYFLTTNADGSDTRRNINRVIECHAYEARLTESTDPKTSAMLDRWTMRRDGVEIGTAEHARCRQTWVHRYRRDARHSTTEVLQGTLFDVASPGEAVRWVVGDPLLGAPHSEPPFTAPRLFISVLPGTTEQIRELCDAWGQTFGEVQPGEHGQDLEEEYAFVSVTTPLV